MKICSFNINSIRARPHQLAHIRDTLAPDVIGLQETKVHDSEFPIEIVEELDYYVEHWGQKGHYGVALLSKEKPKNVLKGFVQDTDEDQKRFIQATYNFGEDEITILNGYFPQGENLSHESKFPKKVKFYKDLSDHISELLKKTENIAVMGDFNVAPADIDVGIGEQNAKRWLKDGKCAFLPEEREMWNKILGLGFYDSWRQVNPEDSKTFSWFDYRSRMFEDDPKRGLRIDHILLSKSLNESLKSVGIDYDARAMEKPSDHCPIWAEIS